jgi:hypothetical protein
VTTYDGGTAFIVFLKSQSHSEDEEERDESQESVTAKTKASSGNGTAKNETAIAVVDDALCIVTEMPKLVLDDDVNKYLAYLTPQCITSNQQGPVKRKIPRLIRAHRESSLPSLFHQWGLEKTMATNQSRMLFHVCPNISLDGRSTCMKSLKYFEWI